MNVLQQTTEIVEKSAVEQRVAGRVEDKHHPRAGHRGFEASDENDLDESQHEEESNTYVSHDEEGNWEPHTNAEGVHCAPKMHPMRLITIWKTRVNILTQLTLVFRRLAM